MEHPLLAADRHSGVAERFPSDSPVGVGELEFLNANHRQALGHVRIAGLLSLISVIERVLASIADELLGHIGGGDEPGHTEPLHRVEGARKAICREFAIPWTAVGPNAPIRRAIMDSHPLGFALTGVHSALIMAPGGQGSTHSSDVVIELPAAPRLHRLSCDDAIVARRVGIVEVLAAANGEESRRCASIDYLKILMAIDDTLAWQSELDLEAFVLATGRNFEEQECLRFIEAQRRWLRRAALDSATVHPTLVACLRAVGATVDDKVARLVAAIS
ncbi:MAG: hypothetical protein IPK66_00325 [Rhodospirillales bacterium]|nr:hypothetical protein [Rhodospirillales bacterium]